jgi:glycosyltransferase involved in cell wall biosynthesis
LSHPSSHQIATLNDVIASVDGVVVMTEAARQLLLDVNSVRPDQITVIPHGAAVMRSIIPSPGSRPLLLTWGLIGPGKGIEWVIDAMAALKDLRPEPLYLVAGHTHPKVFAAQGESYRTSLEERVRSNGVGELVSFDNSYRDLTALNMLIHCADVVILPYDSVEQASSGVLVDAVAAGRPVIATAFPHAKELLASHAGIVVDHGDVGALSDAIRRVLTVPGEMIAQAVRIAPSLSWSAVSEQYIALADQILEPMKVNA